MALQQTEKLDLTAYPDLATLPKHATAGLSDAFDALNGAATIQEFAFLVYRLNGLTNANAWTRANQRDPSELHPRTPEVKGSEWDRRLAPIKRVLPLNVAMNALSDLSVVDGMLDGNMGERLKAADIRNRVAGRYAPDTVIGVFPNAGVPAGSSKPTEAPSLSPPEPE